ncbi:hypothetical protein HJFPF1_07084 [Paramyrothecium foliicola]|nr:hypothetical protein HJFPF1_07084 [Paramyrothecium foliicola]
MPRHLEHEEKFTSFMNWAAFPTATELQQDENERSPESVSGAPFAVQLVRQVNYGPLESKRYFIPSGDGFVEISEKDLIRANF